MCCVRQSCLYIKSMCLGNIALKRLEATERRNNKNLNDNANMEDKY